MASAEEADAKVGQEPSLSAPFVVEHLRRNVTPSGSFTPDAHLILTRSFRASGLLASLPDNETRSLLALLAFLSANGRIEATAAQVADVLKVSEAKGLDRLRRLCRVRWRGEPVAYEWSRENGVAAFAVSGHVVEINPPQIADRSSAKTEEPSPSVSLPIAGREAILSHSRAAYGRPRTEVEQEIAEQLGYMTTTTNEGLHDNDPVARRLLALGVTREQVDLLLASHAEEEITDQLDWLPMRGAKNPARFIVAAIQNKYDPPARVRLEMAIAAEETEAAKSKAESVPSVPPLALNSDLPIGETIALTLPEGNTSSTQIEE